MNHAESARRYAGALTLAEPRQARLLIAQCHAGLARLCPRTGQAEQEREHVATATAMFLEMGMTCWLEKMEAEMKELGR